MIRLIVLCLAVYLVNALDNPEYLQTSTGGNFKYKNNPAINNVVYLYSVDGDPRINIAESELQEDGYWKAVVYGLKPQKQVVFYVGVFFKDDDYVQVSSKQEWTPASLMPLPPRRMRGAVLFRDDFNGNSVNQQHWSVEVTATGDWHNEFQVYTNDPRNVYVHNGHLYLKPTLTTDSGHFTENDLWHGVMDVQKTWGKCTNKGFNGCYRDAKNGLLPSICSGRLESIPTIKYGTITVRAKVPRGDWLWPAIWLLPRKGVYGPVPRSGEIDMMEAASNEVMEWGNGQKVGVQRVTASLHMAPDHQSDPHVTGAKFKKTGDWHENFHDFKVEWTHDHIICYVDNQVITRLDIPNGSTVWKHFNFHGTNPWSHGSKIAPFDQEFFLILNNAVGGVRGIFGDQTKYAYPKPWKNDAKNPLADFWNARSKWLPSWHGDDVAMLIDYVEFRHL